MQGTSTPDHTEWLGSPAFALPHRPKVGNFDEHVTFRPTKKLYAQRAVIDGMRVLIPGYVGLCSSWLGIYALHVVHERHGVSGLLALGPAIFLALALLVTLFVVLLKRVLMGTFRPVIKPLWSVYVWVNELVNGAYESLMSPAIAPFLGTPFVAIFLRWIGCHIGKNCYIETTLFSEFDLVHIGDHVALNHGAVIQNHLFEDRVMKSSSLHIGDNTSVGNMAVVLYDSFMQEGASLGPLSLLMKGETLAAHTHWHGIPAAHIEPPRDTSRRPLNPTPDCG
jgi:non-ribosomal peptide synthetase-like protein